MSKNNNSNFAEGKIWRIIISQSYPLLIAQLVNLLYNIIDRIYIGHLPEIGSLALTGIGLAFPITTLIASFTSLFGAGGAPLFSIARGGKEEEKAEQILGQVFMLLVVSSIVLFLFTYIFRIKILYLFGAGNESIQYANEYIRLYLLGTIFSMLTTGLNQFINAQGFPKLGMCTIVIGAALNLILDPLLIYGANLGVAGAAIATVFSQLVSCIWVLLFFFKGKSLYRIRLKNLRPDFHIIGQICSLGLAGFIMQATNCLVQIICNRTLKIWGGDLYVGIMTVINSVREIMSLPANCVGSGAQPILGFNYGAKKYRRVKEAIRISAILGVVYMVLAWLIVVLFPHFFISIFTTDLEMISLGTPCVKVYFFGFFFMALQFSGQSTFTALGFAKRAVFFSLFRKVLIVVPLTLLLPKLGLGITGVFLAEPISNAIGGTASFLTMWFTVYKKMPIESNE